MEVKSGWEKDKLGIKGRLVWLTDGDMVHIHESLLKYVRGADNKEEGGVKAKANLREQFLSAMEP